MYTMMEFRAAEDRRKREDRKLRLLDLFCGAGGAAMGYYRAGFTEIVGVDIKPQPRYPFTFIQGDALEYCLEHGSEFDAIHASPPCQKHSIMLNYNRKGRDIRDNHIDYIADTRIILRTIGTPYVIENVMGAPLYNSLMLCGTMFGLRTFRHRFFEVVPSMLGIPHQKHKGTVKNGDYCTVVGMGGRIPGRRGARDTESWKEAMRIDWMDRYELTQAIPPAYTEYIGKHLIERLKAQEKL